ncbi:MAG: hypothetical protein EON93_11385 [Burkholderiales bacterium]|nr:MAG: hypothetical protein EON93_11385 [Burkholderiales bacterium]
MIMKQATRLIGSLLAALSFAGAAHAQDVRILGRSQITPEGGFAIQWPASGFEATFTGGTLTATIDDWGANWLNVEVDGVATKVALREGTNSYTLFEGAPGPHKIKVTRRTGTDVGVTRIVEVKAAGLSATTAPEQRLLVIGDSFASGHGVEGANGACTDVHGVQNADLAFPAVLAKSFGADVHVVAADGRGLMRNFGGTGPAMGTLAWQTLQDGDAAWAALAWQPQVIVIELGTNDFNAGDPGEAFSEAYVLLLRKLRTAYPDAQIIGSLGGSLWGKRYEAAKGSISGAIDFVRKAGDDKVAFIEMKLSTGPGRYGCDNHPGIRGQAQMAAALQREITRIAGWKPVEVLAD